MKTVIDCYDVRVWDGGSMHNHKFYVATKEEADKWIAENRFDVVYPITFEIYDTMEDALEGNTEKIRKRALAKLSPSEIKALGL